MVHFLRGALPMRVREGPVKKIWQKRILWLNQVFSVRLRLLLLTGLEAVAAIALIGISSSLWSTIRSETGEGESASNLELEEDQAAIALLALLVLLLADCVASLLGFVSAWRCSISGLLSFFWMTFVLLFPLTFLIIAVFTLQDSFKVQLRFDWDAATFSAVRRSFCRDSSWQGACLVDVGGGVFPTEAAWCEDYFENGSPGARESAAFAAWGNGSYCADVRDAAQISLVSRSQEWFQGIGSGTIVLLLLKCYALRLCSLLLTPRIIVNSIKYISTVLLIGMSVFLTYYGVALCNALEELGYDRGAYRGEVATCNWHAWALLWLGMVSVAVGALGLIGTKLKWSPIIAAHIFGIAITSLCFFGLGISLVVRSQTVADNYLNDEDRAAVADIGCSAGAIASKCCCCGVPNATDRCKEFDAQVGATLISADMEWAGCLLLCSSVGIALTASESHAIFLNFKNFRRGFV